MEAVKACLKQIDLLLCFSAWEMLHYSESKLCVEGC